MSLSWTTAGTWLLHCAAGGGLLLLLTCLLLRRTRQPARRQRLGELGVAAALVLALVSLHPAWIIVDCPAAAAPAPASGPFEVAMPFHGQEAVALVEPDLEPAPAVPVVAPAAPALPAAPAALSWQDLLDAAVPWLVGLYALSAAFVLGRWLLGHLALARLLRGAGPAPAAVAELFAAMAAPERRPRLLVSRRLRVPLSCGLWRPTVLLPATLCDNPDLQKLHWVFAHELTHLERRDAWSALLFALGQAVYFFLPWFGWLRRQVRLCQEYIADAAAAGQDEPAVDYAEFLLSLTGAPAVPAAAAGVSGNCSDLFRRVSMLLKEPVRVESRCPRRWSLAVAGGLLSLAVVVGGIGVRANAAPQVVIILPGDKDGAAPAKPAAGRGVRVIVVPGGAQVEKRPDVRFFKKGPPPPGARPEVKKLDKVLIQKPGQPDEVKVIVKAVPGGKVLWQALTLKGVHGVDALQLEKLVIVPLRDALKKLEGQPGQVDAEAIHKAIRLVQELAVQGRVERIYQGLGNLVQIEIGSDKKADPDKQFQPALDALRRALEHLEKQRGQGDMDAARKQLKAAIEQLERRKLPVELPLKVAPAKVFPGGAGWHVFPGQRLDPEVLKKLREELRKRPDAPELLKALEDFEAFQKKAFPGAQGFYPPAAALVVTVRSDPARLGVQVEKPSVALADQLNLPRDKGLVITSVKADSPAAKAGLKVNDVLLEFNKQPVHADIGAFAALLQKQAGPVDAVVLRKGKQETVKGIEVARRPDVLRWKVKPVVPVVPALPGLPGVPGAGKDGVMTTLFRTGDRFTTRYQEGSLIITLTGTVADGKSKVGQIHVQDGQVAHTYDSLERVPAQYRDKVNHLLEVTSRGQFRTEGQR